MDLVAFYATVAGLSFTLLGLWWVVADKHRSWFGVPRLRRMAYVVSLHFMLPGAMGVLSLVDPTGTVLWRVVFALCGIAGIAGSIMLAQVMSADYGRRRLASGALVVALPVYALLTLVAIAPGVATATELSARQIEGILIALVLLLGINAAWFLTTTPDDAAPASSAPPSAAL